MSSPRGVSPRCCHAPSGVRKAAELSITGNFVDADEALRIGLVNHVVAHDELLPFTRSLADDIAPTGRGRVRCSTSTGAATACRSPTRSRSKTERAAGRSASIPPRSAPPARQPRAAGRSRERRVDSRPGSSTPPIACILEEGFYRASSNKIARRAGVTWGVIQYHSAAARSCWSR